MNACLFFHYGNRMLSLLLLFSKRVQILKTKYKYGKYCTNLTQSVCRYFFLLAITCNMHTLIGRIHRKRKNCEAFARLYAILSKVT